MKEIISVIFMNFFGFDLIIFLAAAFNGFVFYMVKKSSDGLRGKMSRTIYVPHYESSRREAHERVSMLSEEEVISDRDTVGKFYSLFVNITGIFPLLGILGTVVSLLGLVSNMENVTGNFYGALTSTFWGLVFAIVFKFLDGIISPGIEKNEKSVQLYLEGIGREIAEKTDDTASPVPEGNAVMIPEETAAVVPDSDVTVITEDEAGDAPAENGGDADL